VTPRSLDQWLDYQLSLHPSVMDFGLGRMTEMLSRLGLSRGREQVITVGGTNGKGSVTATVAALGLAAGRRVGLYQSPHLVRYTERIRINGREIKDAFLCEVFERIEAVRGDIRLTFFEYGTLAAILAFRLQDLDLWVLEVGLGGRLDAINAWDPDCAVVVSISLDHVEYLGSDLEGIGREKAGIFRTGCPAVLGSADMPASVAAEAQQRGARLYRYGSEFRAQRYAGGFDYVGLTQTLTGLPAPRLAGNAQYGNTATALAALESLDALPSASQVAEGLARVELTGRYQVIEGPVEWVFDVAHNEGSAAVLADTLNERRGAGRTLYIAGMLIDKDAALVARVLAPAVRPEDTVLTVTLEGERGRTARDLAALWSPVLSATVEAAEAIEQACAWAEARAQPGDRVVVFGSFHTVAPALQWRRGRP
jgi:dihydrofolate synthase / folylpolyglutamate synthase